MSSAEILEELRRMPEAERREILETIELEFGDFEDELSPEQAAELDRRAVDALKHPGRGTPIEEVVSELAPGEAELIDQRLQDHLDNPDDVFTLTEVKAKLDAK